MSPNALFTKCNRSVTIVMPRGAYARSNRYRSGSLHPRATHEARDGPNHSGQEDRDEPEVACRGRARQTSRGDRPHLADPEESRRVHRSENRLTSRAILDHQSEEAGYQPYPRHSEEASMTNELIALLDGREIGSVHYKNSRLSFVYRESWRADPDAYPLSLSMPLGSAEHGHTRIEAFLWGLLPDNDRVLENWGRRFQVSPKNVFRLITNGGEEWAGAVQFVSPERLEELQKEPASKEVKWLTEDDVAERLRALRGDHSQWRTAQDTGQFSLAGAQPKTALLFDRKRWGVPSGRVPTTHILKPPTGEWDGHAENEHFSLRLARAAGLVVPNSAVQHFGDEVAIVVERYDRIRQGDRWSRIHQEDMCQALGLHPTRKYESDGGPNAARIAELLRTQSSNPQEDVLSFVDF